MSIAIIGGIVTSGASLIEGNQKSQAAKGTQGAAINAANTEASNAAPYQALALNDLQNPQTAAQLAASYGNNPTYTPINNSTLTGANNVATSTLNNLTQSAPDYTAQAEQELQDFQAQAAPQLQAAMLGIDQNAGETGRIGAEGVTTSLGNLGQTYATNLQNEENQLIEQSMDQGQNNALATENAAQNLSGLTYGQAAGQQADQQALLEQGIQNTLSERGQGNSLGLSLAQLGTNNAAAPALQAATNAQNYQNETENEGLGQLFDQFGNLVATPTAQPTLTAGQIAAGANLPASATPASLGLS